jgi:HAE1 family hydrophobic/amphiphilic exporter-1
MVVIFSVFSFALLPAGFVKNEFFPKTDQNVVYVSVEFPPGTYLVQTKKEALALLDKLKATKYTKFVSLDLGTSVNVQSGGTQNSPNDALFTINLIDKGMRPPSFKIAEDLRNRYASYQTGKLSVIEESGGPPVGADVQIKLLGDDLMVLDSKANEIVSYLNNQPGLTNVEKSIKPGTGKLVFVPDKATLADNGITTDQLGLWLRLYASGMNFDQNKFPGDEESKDITLRLSGSSADVTSIDEVNLQTQNGNIPLSSLGNLRLAANPTLITREDGKRSISISAAARPGFNVSDINQKLEKFADAKLNLSEGYSWKTGGVNEENQNSVNSILQAMLLSFMLIIITMVIQFSSFRRAIIVMLVIPLSISGVFIMFAVSGTPLSFPALIGVLALFGIVVKNSILIVDKIVENQKIGKMSFIEAIGEASASRLEPIALTTVATILGLIPITLTDPLWRGLGGAVIAGLAFSGIIMLFFIPVVYYIFMNETPVPRRRR